MAFVLVGLLLLMLHYMYRHKGTYHTNRPWARSSRARTWPCRTTHPSRTTVAAAKRSTLSEGLYLGLSTPPCLPIQERQLHHPPITCSTWTALKRPHTPRHQRPPGTLGATRAGVGIEGEIQLESPPPRTQGCSARGRGGLNFPGLYRLPPAWGWESLLGE